MHGISLIGRLGGASDGASKIGEYTVCDDAKEGEGRNEEEGIRLRESSTWGMERRALQNGEGRD